MKKKLFANGLGLTIIILFLCTTIFPTINGRIESSKVDLSKSILNAPLNQTYWVIGFMQIDNKTSEYIEVINILGFWITKGSYGGWFEKNESLCIYGFKGIANRDVVIGTFENIVRH